MRCNDCLNELKEYEITFKDPIKQKDICESCLNTYGYDCSIKKWGKDITNKRWTNENQVFQSLSKSEEMRLSTGCYQCKSRAVVYGYDEGKFIPLCLECSIRENKRASLKGWD